MTAVAVAADELGAWEQTMHASGDVVTIDRDCDEVRVTNVNGAASIYFTVNGAAVTVGSKAAYWIPAVAGATRTVKVPTSGDTVVTLDSSGTPIYSVEGSI